MNVLYMYLCQKKSNYSIIIKNHNNVIFMYLFKICICSDFEYDSLIITEAQLLFVYFFALRVFCL